MDWVKYDENDKNTYPEDGKYLVTRKLFNGSFVVAISEFAKSLYDIDKYDFYDKKKAGWYNYDSEYGFYEETGIVGWKVLDEPLIL